jgi:hypothetical protein
MQAIEGVTFNDSWRNATDPSDGQAARSILDYGPGLHYDIVEGVYHARILGVASKGALEKVLRSPAHYKAWVDGLKEEETDALAFGKAFHCALLEPERFATDYVTEPKFGDCRTKGPKEKRDAWREEHKGMIWLAGDDAAAIDGMVASARRHPRLRGLLEGGHAEVTARWRDSTSGIDCKARGDYLTGGGRILLDAKSTQDASHDEFARSAAKWGYHRQQAFYADGFAAAGSPIESFLFVAVEKAAPYAVAVYDLHHADVVKGRGGIRRALDTLADCVERDVYPAYPEEIQPLRLPGWAA